MTGDLVDSMVKFAAQIGWKEDMIQLITKQEGQFVIVSKIDSIIFLIFLWSDL